MLSTDADEELRAALHHLCSGRLAEAEAAGRAALAASDGAHRLPALRLLAAVLGRSGRDAEAAEVLAEAASFDAAGGGREPECWNDLGVALEKIGELPTAEAAFRRALSLRPDFPEVRNHLGNVLRKMGRLAEAAAEHREAVRLRPDYAQAYNNLRAALFELGEVEEGLACDRRAAELEPGNAALGSALLYNLHNSEKVTPGEMFEAHLAWARRHETGVKANVERPTPNVRLPTEEPLCHPALAAFFAPPLPQSKIRNPKSKIRLGYVSPDFREHPVARFLEPVTWRRR